MILSFMTGYVALGGPCGLAYPRHDPRVFYLLLLLITRGIYSRTWVQDVEALLEAYSLQADFFLVQLDNLSGLVDQFQADANYELDRRRNQLFAIQLMITIITMGFSFVSMISGIFGMNLPSDVFEKTGYFEPTVYISAGTALGTTCLLVLYLRRQRMLFLGP